MLSICIYCKKSPPEVEPSDAHIFSSALGGTESSRDSVCAACNGRINRDIETPVLPSFHVLRSLHGIEGRRGVPGVPAVAKIEGHEFPILLGPDGRPKGPIVRVDTDAHGKKVFFVYGPNEAVTTFMDDITRAHPDTEWSQAKYEVPVEVLADGFPVDDPLVRRLAAKVVFERFAQIRAGVIAADSDFDVVREFILTGVEPAPCCGITADPRLLNKSFNFPLPAHAVVIVFHEADSIVGGFVMFFGLFLYWVILSRRYRALASVDALLVEWPHIRQTDRPLLRSGVGAVRVPWGDYIYKYTSDPAAVSRAALQAARLKFQTAIDAAYGPREEPQTPLKTDRQRAPFDAQAQSKRISAGVFGRRSC